MRRAETDEELDERIYSYGDFTKIMNVAKRRLPDVSGICDHRLIRLTFRG